MVKPLKHLIISNENGGSFSEWEIIQINKILKQEPSSLEGKIARTGSIKSLKRSLEEFKEYNPDILGIGGGDGTFSKTITLVNEVWGNIPEHIAPYSLGTVNNWANIFGLTDGVLDKIKKTTHIKSTKPIQLAEYIVDCARFHKEVKTEELDLLDINGKKGLNIGFGGIPKILWGYYGKTIEQFKELEKRLADVDPEKYEWELKKIWDEQDFLADFIDLVSGGDDLLKRTGFVYTLSTAVRSIISSFNPLSPRRNFYQEPFEGELYISGEKIDIENVHSFYISSYDSMNLGYKKLTLYPAPEARKEKGKFQVVICTEPLSGIVKQIDKLYSGKHLDGFRYFLTDEVKITSPKPIISQLEGDFMIADEYSIRYDQTIKVISPFSQTAE